MAELAAQLGHPRGLPGRLVGRLLNRSNKSTVGAAVDALAVPPGAVLADLGFGGGVGLGLLLRRLGATGQVHGVEVSTTMLTGAARRFRQEIEAGRLVLHRGPIEQLPLPSASVDEAITLNTFYFITDLTGALGECARVLKPGGRLVVGLGDPDAMARLPFTAHGFHLRPVAEVAEKLRDASLEVGEHRRVGTGRTAYHLLVATGPPSRDPLP